MSNLENDGGSEIPLDFNLQLPPQSTNKGRRPRKVTVTKSSKKTAGSDNSNNLHREDATPSTSKESYDDNSKGCSRKTGATKVPKKNSGNNIKKHISEETVASEANGNGNGVDDSNYKLRGKNVAIPKIKTIEGDGQVERIDKKCREKGDKSKCLNNVETDAVVIHGDYENEDDRQIAKQIQDGPPNFQFKICYNLKYLANSSYPMKSEPRGLVLIYNIINVKGYKKRRGSEYDVKNLNNLFLRLGYEVKIIEDCTADKFKKTLRKETTKKDMKDMDSFILFIMTHGTSEHLCMQDGGKIQMSYVEEQLDGKNAPLLFNKPKLIFVQACRKGPQIEHDAVRVPDWQPQGKADIFISHSTYEGYYSARIPDKGTWFIRALVLVLEKHAHDWSYSDIMICVQRIVNAIAADIKQSPQKTDSARYHFFFSPIQIPFLISRADVAIYEEEESPCPEETVRDQDTEPTTTTTTTNTTTIQTPGVDILPQARMSMLEDLRSRRQPQSVWDLDMYISASNLVFEYPVDTVVGRYL